MEVGDLIAQRLRRVHERAAQITERRMPGAIAEIAIHYDQSGTRDKAYQYALMAADHGRAKHAHQEAVDLLRIAERNAGSDAAVADVRLRMAELIELLGRYDEAQALCDQALEWMVANADERRSIAPRRIRERIRNLLGQPARTTLVACQALEEEARARGVDAERVSLLVMISHAHTRLGDRPSAERTALEAVRLAERLGDSSLLGDSLVRLGITREPLSANEATALYQRALDLYRGVFNLRGQARCHNNLGIVYQRRGEWKNAQIELESAIAVARTAGMREVWGMSALNIGVMSLKRGDLDTASDRFGEALALFGSMKNTERQLYTVYNLAHLERERGDLEAATELYDVSVAMAKVIGQSDVEIGGRAGYGLALLDQGKDVAARVASLESAERLRGRADWFQGRELSEALRIRILLHDGKTADAQRRLDEALALAKGSDSYGGAWLAAVCSQAFLIADAPHARAVSAGYVDSARSVGYAPIVRRLEMILATS
jgi:tetratricopeptide (TPR) repeat protein